MRYVLIVLSLVLSTSLFAQEINQKDKNGKRHGVWKKYFDRTEILRYEGQFNHGKPIGVFKFYEAMNNKPVLVAKREFNKENDIAEVTFYTSKGNVMGNGKMRNKTYIGEWLYYHKDSDKVMTQEFYNDNGKLQGEKKVFFENGQLAEVSNYENGLLHGESRAYSNEGNLLRLETYKNNKFHGLYKTFDPQGNPVEEGKYFNDERKGVWRFYRNGKLFEEKDLTKRSKNPYKNGKK